MILLNVRLVGISSLQHIQIGSGKIRKISARKEEISSHPDETTIDLEGAFGFPGLINSHDHLDFNLFPALAHKTYSSYTEWGKEIQTIDKEIIEGVLKVPKDLRVRWGMYKNLLNGFTTVVNHGDKLDIKDEFISVIQNHYILHSPAFEKNWKWKLNQPFKGGLSFVMHLGEGTDQAAELEIDRVIKANIFHRRIIAVHGVAMNEKQATNFDGLVWCPYSNFFLLKKTAAIDKLRKKTRIVFGTDSTLTSSWNAWEHFRKAKETEMITENELLSSLTGEAASLWGLKNAGKIETGMSADIVIAEKRAGIFELNPEEILIVIQNGKLKMLDSTLKGKIDFLPGEEKSKIEVRGSIKHVVGNIEDLQNKIKSFGVNAEFKG